MKAVLIAAMALAAMSTGAQAQQNYPPYPDVWGRELNSQQNLLGYSAHGPLLRSGPFYFPHGEEP